MAVDFWILSVMAEQGGAAAQYCFGLLYQRGGVMYKGTKAVPQDMAVGLKWVRKAAEQGHAGPRRGATPLGCYTRMRPGRAAGLRAGLHLVQCRRRLSK